MTTPRTATRGGVQSGASGREWDRADLTTDISAAVRQGWLRDLSAARRALRAAGWTAQEAIDAQILTRKPRRFTVWAGAVLRRSELIVLYVLQDGRCYLCGGRMGVRTAANLDRPDDATRDHVRPRRLRGKDVGNLLAAHRSCNEAKAARAPYPCELLYLEAVSLRLAHSATPAATRSA